MPVIAPTVPEDVLSRTLLVLRAEYNFAADGGAVGDIPLTSGAPIPAGSYVLGCYIEVVTPPTSGGAATIALKVESAGDLQAAAAISGAPWSTAGRKVGTLTLTSVPVKTTADRNVVATVGTAALTAGAFRVIVVCLPPLG
jgi:hypothetical protein